MVILNVKVVMSKLEEVLKSGINWDDYEFKADKYLKRFKTPMTGKMLRNAAENTYKKTNIHVPLELALSQAQFESMMGTKGRSPSTNPYNVGEYDEGTKIRFKTMDEGVNRYFDLMANDYLRSKTMDELLNNFVNYQGNRYASNPKYESDLKGQVEYIRKFWGDKKIINKSNTFGDAFKKARQEGLKTFMFNGKEYTTEVK